MSFLGSLVDHFLNAIKDEFEKLEHEAKDAFFDELKCLHDKIGEWIEDHSDECNAVQAPKP
jgi:hypothetical protein